MSSDEGGLRRWARRKAETKRERAAPVLEEEAGKAPAVSEPAGIPAGEEGEGAKPPAELDLPDIESLTPDSDFTVFMKDGVPPALRRLALRKLWASSPMFNVIDEMVEYGEDYTNAAMVVEGMKSAWEPGRGYAREETPKEEPVSEAAEAAETAEGDAGEKTVAADGDASGHAGEEEGADDVGKDEETDLG